MQSYSFLAPLAPLAAACLCMLLACAANDGGDTGASSSTAAPMTDASATAGDTGNTGNTGTAAGTTGSSTDIPTTDVPTTGGSTDATATATTEASAGESTGPAPTDGPGVLPGETGLEAFCRRYGECGGTYYADEQACLDASLDYWGSCPSRRTALDNFGACMSELDCNDWSPDAYQPASTPCAAQWEQVGASASCN